MAVIYPNLKFLFKSTKLQCSYGNLCFQHRAIITSNISLKLFYIYLKIKIKSKRQTCNARENNEAQVHIANSKSGQ